MEKTYDFSGWATRSGIKCSDGRTIMENAFIDDDGAEVPLVWNHQHNSPNNVLGHALLKNQKGGVRTFGYFNDTEDGRIGRNLVQHKDIVGLSIYANKLKQNQETGEVIHGKIREVSLVLAGANPGAYIDEVIAHGDGEDDAAIIYYALDDAIDNIEHADEPQNGNKTYQDVINTMNEEQQNVLYAIIGELMESIGSDEISHSDDEEDEKEMDIEKILEGMTEEQLEAVNALLEAATEEYEDDDEDEEQEEYDESEDEEEDDEDMKHNVFENDEIRNDEVLMHAEEDIFKDAKRSGSLKDAFNSYLAHADYGIEDIEQLFPEPHELNNTPEFIGRPTDWVSVVMNGVHRSPFSRVKSRWADITEDEARARGYIKGKLKKEEVFSLLKRSTSPTTIYKKQKLDRDDILDITDFDVVAWIKGEMRLMLNEEIARAILIGDGRLASDDDKIPEDHIRPILSDADLFVIRWGVASGSDVNEKCKNFIRAAIKARKNYRGSGNPALFTTEDMLTDMLLLEDSIGHKLYKTEAELATALRVSRIVTVPVMDGLTVNDDGGVAKDVYGIIVNLDDYQVGADKGGEVTMFSDFDIDYNQEKYLLETRRSGALTKPFSAIVLREADATASLEPTMAEAMAEFKA